jgi:hypothetical protein
MVEGTPPMAFKIDESAQVQRDPDGTVRAINHPLAPYLLDKVPDESRLVESAREMVLSYLKEVQQYLGLSEDELRHLRSTTSSRDPHRHSTALHCAGMLFVQREADRALR